MPSHVPHLSLHRESPVPSPSLAGSGTQGRGQAVKQLRMYREKQKGNSGQGKEGAPTGRQASLAGRREPRVYLVHHLGLVQGSPEIVG